MGLNSSRFSHEKDSAEEILKFDEKIRLHENQLFGISLYFQGVELMCSGQSEILDMNRRSFQNIKDRAENAIAAAKLLLQEARENPSKIEELRQFTFPPIEGHPMLDQMTQRAQILIQTYERIFPGRSRTQPLNQDELMVLTREAAEQI